MLGSLSLWEKENRQDISYILPVIVIGRKIVFYLLFNKLGYLFTVGGYYFDGVDTGCEVCYFDSLNIIFYAFYTSSREREDVYALYFFAFHRDVIGCRIRSYCNTVVFYPLNQRLYDIFNPSPCGHSPYLICDEQRERIESITLNRFIPSELCGVFSSSPAVSRSMAGCSV